MSNAELVSLEKVNSKNDGKNEVNFINDENIESTDSEEVQAKKITEDLNNLFGHDFKININCGSSKLDIGLESIIKLINDCYDLYVEIK